MTRVLVAYASRHGGTAEIAQAVAESLRDDGIEADLRPAAQVADVAPFDAIVLGSAVYMNKWQGEAVEILKRVERRGTMPVWLFSSGPTGGSDDSEAKAAQILAAQPAPPGDAGKRAARLDVRDHATFGGRVGEDMTGLLERWMPRGDWRDMDAVRRWARSIAAELRPVSHAPAG